MKNEIKKVLTVFRNCLAFSYAWLVFCSVAATSWLGNTALPVSYLFKLLALCTWASVCFSVCFSIDALRKKGFIFCLSLFYVLFIPVEIAMFYLMNIFGSSGSAGVWMIFAVIVFGLYAACILIDRLIMAKKADVYTEKLKEYNQRS